MLCPTALFVPLQESVGFQQNASTLACGLITDRHVVQICARAVHLCAPTHTAHPSGIDADQPYTATWRPPDGACVSVGAVSTGRVVVGLSRPSGLVMLGVEKRPSDGGYVSLVQLQSCSLGAELSCIALQDAPHADDVSASQRDVSVSRDEVTAGAEPSSEASTSGSRLEKSNEEIFARLRFAAQAGSVCVLGTYRPSVEVRSALPGDGFRLLASVPLAAGTEYQQQNISPGLGMSSDVRKSAVPTAGCVPESLLLSFLDRGYLLVGLRNGLLARYEWPTARLEAALSARGSGSFAPQHSGRGPAEETEEPAGEAGRGTTRPEEAPLETVGGSTSGERGVGQRTSGANRIRPSDRASAGTGLPSLAPSTANGDAAFPITLHQVGERRIGSAPVSLIPLAKPDPSGRIPQNVRCDPDENGRNPDTAGMRLDAAERIPEAAGPALNAVDRTSDGSAPNADAAGTDLDAQDGSRDDSDRIAASVSSAFADVLVLSNQPWLLHRSARGRGRMMTSLLSQPASSHATGVSCRECPRGIVFITDCCMHLVSWRFSPRSSFWFATAPSSFCTLH